MRRFFNCINMLIFLFVCFEPLYSYGINYFDIYKNSPSFSSNDGIRDSARLTAINENEPKAIDDLIVQLFPKNAGATPKAMPSLTPIPNTADPPTTRKSSSTFSTVQEKNITTSYYTTQVDNYPDFSVIENKLKKFQGLSIKDALPKPDLSTHTLIENNGLQYEHLCRSEIELITPRGILNKDNKQIRVVNYPQFQQVLRAERCADADGACSYSENFPNNMVPICKQNYIFRQVITMTDSNDPDLVAEDIPIPSCCECVLKYTNTN